MLYVVLKYERFLFTILNKIVVLVSRYLVLNYNLLYPVSEVGSTQLHSLKYIK